MSASRTIERLDLAGSAKVPPLEPGDTLSREEFERRYDAMPNLKKAELIEGVVYIPSAVRWRLHGNPHFQLITWLGHYQAQTPGVQGGDNTSVRLDLENEPQPDAVLLIDPACGGQAKFSDDDYVVDAPEWIGEVAASSASIDLHRKFRVNLRNQVQEYVVWRVFDQEIDWFILKGSQYKALPPDAGGIRRSQVLPGLWLDTAAMIRGDLARVLKVLDEGLASPEHAQFVKRLSSSKSGDG